MILFIELFANIKPYSFLDFHHDVCVIKRSEKDG